MKATKIIFWVSTIIIFLFEGVMPALFSQQKESIEGFTHLGYPVYFVTVLTVFKVLGTLALIIPQVPKRIKEWAYAGFTFDFLCASISYFVVDGIVFFAFFPLIILAILMVSYFSYHKLNKTV
ncbi:DoxX family protein [Ferruginibacter sp.]